MPTADSFKLLIMEDANPARTVLAASLCYGGFAGETVSNPGEALDALHAHQFDLVLLDVENLPGIETVTLCRSIRDLAQSIGILLLIAPHVEKEVVLALEAGADDYITKPFRIVELISRCRVVLHRSRAGKAIGASSFTVGDMQLDLERRQFRKAGKIVHLSPIEFSLLAFLIKNRGTALTHAQLLRAIWGPEYGQELEYLRAYIRLLRKKIETKPSQPQYLLTEPWVGYRFRGPTSSDDPGSTSARC